MGERSSLLFSMSAYAVPAADPSAHSPDAVALPGGAFGAALRIVWLLSDCHCDTVQCLSGKSLSPKSSDNEAPLVQPKFGFQRINAL